MTYSSEEEGYESRTPVGAKRGGRALEIHGEAVSEA